MNIVIDTNSLLSLVRYYLPFDKHFSLFNFIKTRISEGEIIIIDKVMEECSFTSKGLVIEKLSYLTDKNFLHNFKVPYKTDTLLPPAPSRFIRQLENQFVNHALKSQRRLTETEFENQKSKFLESADIKQIILCLNILKDGNKVYLVSEETESSNDNKLFKKIPSICKELRISSCTLPELLKEFYQLDIMLR